MDGVHVDCNQRYLDLLGVTYEQVLGHRIEDFAPGDIVQVALTNDLRLRENGDKTHLSYRITFTDYSGRKRHVEVEKSSLSQEGTDNRYIIGCVLDITEQVGYHDELLAQHKFLRTIIDNLPQLFYAKDTESRFTLANKATALRMTGQPDPSKLIGKTDAEFYRPGLWVKYYNDEQEVIRSGKPLINVVELCEDVDGNRCWNNSTKIPIFDDDGVVKGIIGIGSDFTQFKKTEEQLRLLATALESAADGVIITDRQGVIIWANSAIASISGYSMAEIIGSTPSVFKSGFHTQEFFRQLWRTITAGQVWQGEIINRRKDGSMRTEETIITPVHNEAGRITHFVSICRDVTDRQLIKAEMSRIYAAVSGAKDGILLVSRDNRPFFVNKAFSALLGYGVGDLPEALLDQITLERDNGWDGPAQPGILGTRQVTLTDSAGKSIPIEIRSWTVRGTDDENLGQVYFLRDLSEERRMDAERKMMEVQLRQAQKMEAIGQLAAGIAHEINNPIQFVSNNTTFLKSIFSDLTSLVEAQRRTLEQVRGKVDLTEVDALIKQMDYDYITSEVPEAISQTLEGIKRVSDIVKAMKDFSHPGSRNRQRTDLNKAVQDSVLVARNEWKYNSDVETILSPDMPAVFCQAGEVNQVLLNILVNAAHAINEAVAKGLRKRGTITISTEHDENEARIIFKDNGCGIPKSIQDRIFEPFFTTKEVGKGTGQGLAIAYDVVVRKHDGKLTFESVEGEGTTFVVALPIKGKGAKET
jgi:PAS domain S-box-containing protein